VLCRADQVIYVPPAQWSDRNSIDTADPTACVQGLTENLLLLVSDLVEVKNIEQCYLTNNPIELADSRRTDQPQMWSVGCSFTHGDGVAADQRYGQLLANELGMACSFLTRVGTSITWAADQILRSDVRSGDLVIWGITSTERSEYVNQDQLQPVTVNSHHLFSFLTTAFPRSNLLEQDLMYRHLYSIEHVINFCKTAQAQLILFGLLVSPNLLRYLKTKKNYANFPYQFRYHQDINNLTTQYQDFGRDGMHPGPLQHQQYKNFLLPFLKQSR